MSHNTNLRLHIDSFYILLPWDLLLHLLSFSAPAGPASTNLRSESLCYRGGGGRKGGKGGDGSGGREGEGDGELGKDEDPTVPLLRQNVYAWYLAVSIIIITCRAIVLYICKNIAILLILGFTMYVP